MGSTAKLPPLLLRCNRSCQSGSALALEIGTVGEMGGPHPNRGGHGEAFFLLLPDPRPLGISLHVGGSNPDPSPIPGKLFFGETEGGGGRCETRLSSHLVLPSQMPPGIRKGGERFAGLGRRPPPAPPNSIMARCPEGGDHGTKRDLLPQGPPRSLHTLLHRRVESGVPWAQSIGGSAPAPVPRCPPSCPPGNPLKKGSPGPTFCVLSRSAGDRPD